MAKREEYWRKRFEQVKEDVEEPARDYAERVEKQSKIAQAKLRKDIDAWYQRYAENNEISLADAKKQLRGRELEEFRWTVEEYIEKARQGDKWAKELENASARVHVTRLESLLLQLQQHAEELTGGQLDELDALLRETYAAQYGHILFEMERGGGLHVNPFRYDKRQLEAALGTAWVADGKNWSDRVWTNKAKLTSELQTGLIQGIIRGENPDKLAAQLAKKLDVSAYAAKRIAHTEAAYIAERASIDCYESLGVEEIELLCTLDSKTCPTCGALDGKRMRKSDMVPGVTTPPFHVFCRCTTVPIVEEDDDDDDVGTRAARDENGKTIYVPGNMTYAEWKKGLTSNTSGHIIDMTVGGKFKKLQSEAEFVSLSEAQDITPEENAELWSRDGGHAGYIQAQKNYRPVNDYMRALTDEVTPENAHLIETMKAVTNRNVLSQNLISFRKVDAHYLKDVLGIDEGGLKGGFDLKSQASAERAAKKIRSLAASDKVIKDKAVTSVSLLEDKNYFTMRPVEFVIQTPKGTKGLVTTNIDESEFMVAPNTDLEILGAETYHPIGKSGKPNNRKTFVRIFAKMIQER
jgi:SPP1 gp7 family putative phage head morphogenesis protein